MVRVMMRQPALSAGPAGGSSRGRSATRNDAPGAFQPKTVPHLFARQLGPQPLGPALSTVAACCPAWRDWKSRCVDARYPGHANRPASSWKMEEAGLATMEEQMVAPAPEGEPQASGSDMRDPERFYCPVRRGGPRAWLGALICWWPTQLTATDAPLHTASPQTAPGLQPELCRAMEAQGALPRAS